MRREGIHEQDAVVGARGAGRAPAKPQAARDRLLAALPRTWQRWNVVARRAGLTNRAARSTFTMLQGEGLAEASADGTAWRKTNTTRG